jgi:hypothetical protein
LAHLIRLNGISYNVSLMTARKDSSTPQSRRTRVGRLLDRCGQLGLPLAVGVFIGYWAADQGIRWMPTMLEALSIFIAFALLLILVGQWLKGKVVRETDTGAGIRKRTVTLLVLAVCAALVRLAVFWAEQPTHLTSLASDELVKLFQLDCRQYRLLDQEMERLVRRVEQVPRLRPNLPRQALSAADEEALRDIWSGFYASAFALDQIRVFWEDWYRFDPSRAERPSFLRAYLLTFATELSLFEKSFRLTRLFDAHPEVKKFLDAPHPDLGMPEHTFSRFRQEFLGSRDEARVVAGEQYLKLLETTLNARTTAAEHGFDQLWQDVERHLDTISGTGIGERAEHTVRADLQVVKRAVRRTWYPTQKEVANWMGDVKTRRIGSYLITPEQLSVVDARLEPGDIMLSRKNWYLSNVGLPGFWPHAILYIGDPKELNEAFDTSEVRAFLRSESGQDLTIAAYLEQTYPAVWARYQAGLDDSPIEVIEAVGEGVILNTLAGAAGDYLAALRPRLPQLAKAQAVIAAFGHIDKPYDFDFDFATDHALVCTELVWRSYRQGSNKEGLDLPLVEIAGRLTLPANRIAEVYAEELGTGHQQLDFVYFLDGREEEQQSMVADEAVFRSSYQRFKWDILQR